MALRAAKEDHDRVERPRGGREKLEVAEELLRTSAVCSSTGPFARRTLMMNIMIA